jgi:hypothetical protein
VRLEPPGRRVSKALKVLTELRAQLGRPDRKVTKAIPVPLAPRGTRV